MSSDPPFSFLSTLSLRRATALDDMAQARILFLSTLSLRRATAQKGHFVAARFISIHALLAESDWAAGGQAVSAQYFYPRSPCGERHGAADNEARSLDFYPRSPCGERQQGHEVDAFFQDFYPRSPCGERLSRSAALCCISGFLSTLSLRRATLRGRPALWFCIISIHALLAESDAGQGQTRGRAVISIHALLAESDGSFRLCV